MNEPPNTASVPPAAQASNPWTKPIVLFALTFLSTTYVAAVMEGGAALPFMDGPEPKRSFWVGLHYSVPLLAILLAHEFGHYLAARMHRVAASPPYFIPLPIPPLGTLGAVILMPNRIERRNALLDIGAAGPLAGLAVALPVLVYGLQESRIEPLTTEGSYILEGHSVLYLAIRYLVKGPIPEGYDVLLSPTAFAGWAGLLVTMINLLPALQLDGGHIAYALFGNAQLRYSAWIRRLLLPLAALVSLSYGLPALFSGAEGDALTTPFSAGLSWLVWWFVLRGMAQLADAEHPPTDPGELSPARRIVAWFTLALFALLFMPVWMREVFV